MCRQFLSEWVAEIHHSHQGLLTATALTDGWFNIIPILES